ncbi:hypothetical protein GCM10027285_13320 [Oleiagrimonas citrea]|uniref:Uncharacterized protein n=1 Tax=Oleiagrimonas citrea TaxID=1665687 RepID=A0A846ZPP4_9GAMM|nr:hypothetical protein [Oleiagrimonas citrea]NKZ40245.1 hypothetical protein [Oleiagrimonas citrea]
MTPERVFIPNHSPALFDRAEKSSKRGEGVSTCILAVSATEAFTHDLTEWYKFCADHKLECPNNKDKGLFSPDRFTTCFSVLHKYTDLENSILEKISKIESSRERDSLLNKYLELYAICKNGEKADKGANPYQDFSLLIKIRNSIVHTKGEMLSNSNGYSKIDGHPYFIETLSQKNVISKNQSFSSWLNLIENKNFAKWSLEIAEEVIENAINMLPKTEISELFKDQASLHKTA